MNLPSQFLEMGQRDGTVRTSRQTVLAIAAQRRFDKYRVSRVNRQDRLYLANRASLAGIAGLAKFPIDFRFIQIYAAPSAMPDCAA